MIRARLCGALWTMALLGGLAPAVQAQHASPMIESRRALALASLRTGDQIRATTGTATFKGRYRKCDEGMVCVGRGAREWSFHATELRELSRVRNHTGLGMVVGAILGGFAVSGFVVGVNDSMCRGDASCPPDDSLGWKAGGVGGLIGGVIGLAVGAVMSSSDPLFP